MPMLQCEFPIAADDRTLLGNSLGGLFPTWILFKRPALFQRYVIASPSWWWNDYEVWQWEADYAAMNNDLGGTSFVTFGGLETAPNHRATVERAISTSRGELRKTLKATLIHSDREGWRKARN